MDFLDVLTLAGVGFCYLSALQQSKQKQKRRWWVRPIISRRKDKGHFDNLMQELKFEDKDWFYAYTRMERRQFEWILRKISPFLEKEHLMREPLSPELKLFVTLRYLATGDQVFTVAADFRIGVSTTRGVIYDVCKVLWNVLYEYAFPDYNEETWLSIARDFLQNCRFPHVVGCIDGKHIRVRAPKHSGSLYRNFKGYFSVVLLGVADSTYRLIYVNIGSFGSSSDGGILGDSVLQDMIEKDRLKFPRPSPLLPGEENIPYFFLGDEAFGLKSWLMIPYHGGNLEEDKFQFNRRLSKARRVVESSFGLLAARWRIYHTLICASPENVDYLLKGTVVLHNLLCGSRSRMYYGGNQISEETEDNLQASLQDSVLNEIPRQRQRTEPRNISQSAINTRNYLKNFFTNETVRE
uniref:Uncharacterized protein n=1 Tax=Phlebotomus papatasi TaxID=29031 RepID=A0A1B0DEF5_PHLPP